MLNGFQTDLSSISCEIQTLQQQSVAMNQRLKNRQAVRGELSQFVDEMVVPDAMITSVIHSSSLCFITPLPPPPLPTGTSRGQPVCLTVSLHI